MVPCQTMLARLTELSQCVDWDTPVGAAIARPAHGPAVLARGAVEMLGARRVQTYGWIMATCF